VSREFVALLRERPEIRPVLEGLEVAPGLALSLAEQPGVTQVFDGGGRLLVIIRNPVLIAVPSEAERLLGTSVTSPVWWVELRAAGGVAEAVRIAEECADRLAADHDGLVWNETSP
jgi:hypothetical protein